MNLYIIFIAPKFTYYCIFVLLLLHFKTRLLLLFFVTTAFNYRLLLQNN